MRQIKIVPLSILLGVMVIGASSPVLAQESNDDTSTETMNEQKESKRESHRSNFSHENSDVTHSENESDNTSDDKSESQSTRIAQRRAELKQRFQALKDNRSEKLEGKRLETCQKRESKINMLLHRSVERSKKRVAFFQSVEGRVRTFYQEKNLSSADYEAASVAVDEKEAAALAAIDVMAEETFQCDTVDGGKPGAVISSSLEARHSAMKNYRDAIKALIKSVKTALGVEDTNTSDEEGAAQ